jgi:hypothetical protein
MAMQKGVINQLQVLVRSWEYGSRHSEYGEKFGSRYTRRCRILEKEGLCEEVQWICTGSDSAYRVTMKGIYVHDQLALSGELDPWENDVKQESRSVLRIP